MASSYIFISVLFMVFASVVAYDYGYSVGLYRQAPTADELLFACNPSTGVCHPL